MLLTLTCLLTYPTSATTTTTSVDKKMSTKKPTTTSPGTLSIISPAYTKLKVLRPNSWVQFRVTGLFGGPSSIGAQIIHVKSSGWNGANVTMSRGKLPGTWQSNNVSVPADVGFANFTWLTSWSDKISYQTQVDLSCTDGIVCNGMEQLVYPSLGGIPQCRPSPRMLCDDRTECTIDTCDSTGRCTHTRNPNYTMEECPLCTGNKCIPHCKGKVCGSDGCGGVCGKTCEGDNVCLEGKCTFTDKIGTCKNPLLDIQNLATASNFNGTFVTYGNNKVGLNIIHPICNRGSNAKELIYSIKVAPSKHYQFVGLDARVMSATGDPTKLDTVLQLIEADPSKYPADNPSMACVDAENKPDNVLIPGCSDDASPPGGYSSRVQWMLKPGVVYFLQVDGYDQNSGTGPFQLTVRLSPECNLACSGKRCGDSGCAGFTCGDCDNGKICNNDFVCAASPCKPNCKNRNCGDDGCGGSCGVCNGAKGEWCLEQSEKTPGVCKTFGICNVYHPECHTTIKSKHGKPKIVPGCGKNEYCSTECKCLHIDDPTPDLMVDITAATPILVEDYLVEKTSCALQEKCVLNTGKLRIIKFDTNVLNQGSAMFNPPNPPSERPDLYEWARCHGHFHFDEFAEFHLVDPATNEIVVRGYKRSYCAVDHSIYEYGPNTPCQAVTTCTNQGISRGWIDVYSSDLDCQFIDLTGVKPGKYIVRQCINPARKFFETTFENNCIDVPFTLPPAPKG
jgi:hypothetical protein